MLLKNSWALRFSLLLLACFFSPAGHAQPQELPDLKGEPILEYRTQADCSRADCVIGHQQVQALSTAMRLYAADRPLSKAFKVLVRNTPKGIEVTLGAFAAITSIGDQENESVNRKTMITYVFDQSGEKFLGRVYMR